MNWCHPVELQELQQKYLRSDPTPQPFRIHKLPTDHCHPQEMNVIAQLYVAPYILVSPEYKVQIPIGNTDAYQLTKEHLIPHFEEYKEVRVQNAVSHVILGKLRPESKLLFDQKMKNRELNAIIMDLYRQKVEDFESHIAFRETIPYKIDKECLQSVNDNECDQLWPFLRNTTLACEGHASFSTIGWQLNDRLLDSILLRSMCQECDDIFLLVDPLSQKVLHVQGFKRL